MLSERVFLRYLNSELREITDVADLRHRILGSLPLSFVLSELSLWVWPQTLAKGTNHDRCSRSDPLYPNSTRYGK